MTNENQTKVNISARNARHARLKLQKGGPSPDSSPFRFSLRFLKGVFFGTGQSENPLVTKLGLRIVALAAAFLMVTSFLPFYQITAGYYSEEEGTDFIALTEQDADDALTTVMTEDGFLLKPAITTVQGDRSSFSEIFAYTVEPGDTLSSIAEQFNLKKQTLLMENNLWNPNQLRKGMTLKILPVDGISHVVKKNQTLDSIAKQYKVPKETIVKQNQLETETLVTDTLLIIPGGAREVTAPKTYVGASAPAAAGPGSAGIAKGQLLWPVGPGAKLTQGFRRGHYALDLANRDKGPIYAAASGKVVTAKNGWNGGYGNYIIIDHGAGLQTLYAHNEKLYVEEGQYVEQGQTISWMGNTGRVHGVTGIHLHFEVRINGVKYNPMNFFQ